MRRVLFLVAASILVAVPASAATYTAYGSLAVRMIEALRELGVNPRETRTQFIYEFGSMDCHVSNNSSLRLSDARYLVQTGHSCRVPSRLDRSQAKILVDALQTVGVAGRETARGDLHLSVKSVRCSINKGVRASLPNRMDRRFVCSLQG
jgi:hypothetical protein